MPFSVIPSKTVGNVPAVALPGQALDNISPPVLNVLAVFSAQTDNPLLTGSLGNNIDAEWAHAQCVRMRNVCGLRLAIPLRSVFRRLHLRLRSRPVGFTQCATCPSDTWNINCIGNRQDAQVRGGSAPLDVY